VAHRTTRRKTTTHLKQLKREQRVGLVGALADGAEHEGAGDGARREAPGAALLEVPERRGWVRE